MLVLSCMYLYKTYAVFTEEKHFNVINGTVQDPGDIYFAYYVDNTITREMPKKGTGYTLDTEKSNCTNGVVPTWDDDTYSAILNYENYNATDYTRTKCNLYFKATALKTIVDLAKIDTVNLAYDGTTDNNLRYIGKDPNNYVSVDGELWRIIGVMNNIDNGNGKSSRVKLIRNESIGAYSWDTSESSINGGYGVNEWSQADIMKLLNPGYESESVGGSLYWNNQSGTCYNDSDNGTTSCDFTNIGLKNGLKSLIGNAFWNIGAATTPYQITSEFYKQTHENSNGKICSSGTYCNDTVIRTTTWMGKVGLPYPSDYGYATSGSTSIERTSCLAKNLYSMDSDCKNNDWLYLNNMYTMQAQAQNTRATYVFIFPGSSFVFAAYSHSAYQIYPTVYLSPSVVIQSGDGSETNPFILE